MNSKENNQLEIETNLVQSGILRSDFGETSEAIFLNSAYVFDTAEIAERRFSPEGDGGFKYSRYSNPNLKMLEDRLVSIEKSAEAACAVGSGMAAVFITLLANLNHGDHIISSKSIFSSCRYIITNILPKFGIEYTIIEGDDEEKWNQAFKKNTKLVFVETPGNPTLDIIDIKRLSKITHQHNCLLVVDNALVGPLVQPTLSQGVDIVIYSTTKHIDGSGRTLGGAILSSNNIIEKIIRPFHRHTGAALSPFNAWMIFKSLETFCLRSERYSLNALKVAEFLESEEKQNIEKVVYPLLRSHPQNSIAQKQMQGGGSVISFYLKTISKEEIFKFLNNLKIIKISNNFGDNKSLINCPYYTTHASLTEENRISCGITPNLVRLSVGLEHPGNIIDDLRQALSKK